jgi:hypothetical protein
MTKRKTGTGKKWLYLCNIKSLNLM